MPSFEEIPPYVIAAVIIFLIQSIITKRFRKTNRSIWITFLRKTNKIINESLSTFEKIESTNNKWIEFSKPMIPSLAFIVILILYFIILILSENIYISMAYTSLIISLLILSIVLILINYTSNKIDEGNLLDKSNKIKDIYSFINWLFYGIISFIFPSIYLTIVTSTNILVSDSDTIRYLYAISIIFIMMTMVVLFISFRTLFFGTLKYEINKQYSKDFPTVHISTNVEILIGKIHNIFDEDLIILDDDGVTKGTQWKDIIVITIDHNPVLEE